MVSGDKARGRLDPLLKRHGCLFDFVGAEHLQSMLIFLADARLLDTLTRAFAHSLVSRSNSRTPASTHRSIRIGLNVIRAIRCEVPISSTSHVLNLTVRVIPFSSSTRKSWS